jgi:hypothetical protein
MSTRILALIGMLLLVLSSAALAGNEPRINPYLPRNAVAATPLTPYNLWEIPRTSRKWYAPCPTCVRPGLLLPDVPNVRERIQGRKGRPVRVP